MDALWHTVRRVYPDGQRPKRHESKPASFFIPLIEALATPNPNKSDAVVSHAEALLKRAEAAGRAKSPIKSNAPGLKAPGWWSGISGWVSIDDELDAVFYTAMGVAVYGFSTLFSEMGIFFCVPYVLLSVKTLKMCKDRYAQISARTAIALVWVLEIVTAPVHYTMFLRRSYHLRDTIESCPDWLPWVAAGILATLFSGAAIYAVTMKRRLLVEKIDAEAWEAETGKIY